MNYSVLNEEIILGEDQTTLIIDEFIDKGINEFFLNLNYRVAVGNRDIDGFVNVYTPKFKVRFFESNDNRNCMTLTELSKLSHHHVHPKSAILFYDGITLFREEVKPYENAMYNIVNFPKLLDDIASQLEMGILQVCRKNKPNCEVQEVHEAILKQEKRLLNLPDLDKKDSKFPLIIRCQDSELHKKSVGKCYDLEIIEIQYVYEKLPTGKYFNCM